MRRLLPLILLTATLPLAGGTASASCPNPEEGEPPPCCTHFRNVVEIGDGVVYLTIPDPTQPPCYRREIVLPPGA